MLSMTFPSPKFFSFLGRKNTYFLKIFVTFFSVFWVAPLGIKSILPSLLDFKHLEVLNFYKLCLTHCKYLSYIYCLRVSRMKCSNAKVLVSDRRHVSPNPGPVESFLHILIRLQFLHVQIVPNGVLKFKCVVFLQYVV